MSEKEIQKVVYARVKAILDDVGIGIKIMCIRDWNVEVAQLKVDYFLQIKSARYSRHLRLMLAQLPPRISILKIDFT